jgi:pimeloyl-ACP methyl ester carboxylesterase
VIGDLAERFFVLAPDLPEIGESRGAPKSAEKTVLAGVLLAAAEQAGGCDIVVAGIDVGGMISFAAARDHGQRIRGAVVANRRARTGAVGEAACRSAHLALCLPCDPRVARDDGAGPATAVLRLFHQRFGRQLQGSDRGLSSALCRGVRAARGFEGGLRLVPGARRRRQAQRTAEGIETPLLYLRGDADGRSPDDYLPGLRQAGVRQLESAVLKGSGEFAPFEAPEAFVEALMHFARRR